MANDFAEKADELDEILTEMKEQLSRALRTLRRTGIIERRAQSYWLAQVATALDDEHEFLGSSMCTLAGTIAELRNAAEPEDDEDGPTGPESCPGCGCRPGEGYTTGCPDCKATAKALDAD